MSGIKGSKEGKDEKRMDRGKEGRKRGWMEIRKEEGWKEGTEGTG